MSPLSSSSSGSNKSVKFRDHVGVRRPRSRSTSGLSPDAKVEEDIKPGDESTPKGAGTFGEKPRFSPDREYYARKAWLKLNGFSPSGSTRCSTSRDKSPDLHWDREAPLSSPGYGKGAFASMASGGLGSDTPKLGGKWAGLNLREGPFSHGPLPNEPRWGSVHSDHNAHDGLEEAFDGASEGVSPKTARSRRRSVFANVFVGVDQGRQIPKPPQTPHTPSSGSNGQAHTGTAGEF